VLQFSLSKKTTWNTYLLQQRGYDAIIQQRYPMLRNITNIINSHVT